MHGQPEILFADVNIRTQLTNKTIHYTTYINQSATKQEIVNIYKNKQIPKHVYISILSIVHRTCYTELNDISQIISQQIGIKKKIKKLAIAILIKEE